MTTPNNWSQLTTEVADDRVAPAQELRPGDSGILQYVQNGVEYLAVNSANPYGTETGGAFEIPKPAHLLEGVDRGDDYTSFVIPKEALALQALTFGTGAKRAELLRAVYHDIGEILGNLSIRPDVRAPRISTGDVAVDRLSGEILLVPPLSFGRRTRTAEEYTLSFVQSVDNDIGGVWPQQAVELIKDEVIKGVDDGSRTP